MVSVYRLGPVHCFCAVLLATFLATAAQATPTWQTISVKVQPGGEPTVQAAFDKLMASEVGKSLPGQILLQLNAVDGDNPATHSFVPIYGSAAEQEAFVTKLVADPAWAEFQKAVQPVSETLATVRYSLVKSWGDMKAMETFQATKTGQSAPGQVHLSAVFAGGLSPITHVVSVGYKSQAEMESFGDTLPGNSDWAAQIEAIRNVSDLLGSNLALTVKGWGNSLKDALTP